MLELKEVSKTYPGAARPALDKISLNIKPGELVVILGRSGAGKSTLIRCINRLVEPDRGSIIWNDKVITGMKMDELREIRGEIGMIFQHFHLLPRVSVWTNVIAGRFATMPRWRSLIGAFSQRDRADAMEALKQVGLGELYQRRVEELSGGQQQRVAIARVLMQRPTLLLGDEPISSLDLVTAERVMTYIAEMHRDRQMTIVMNLHDVSAARTYATRIVGMAAGHIVFDGSPQQLGEAELRMIYPQDDDNLNQTTNRKG